MSDTCHLTPVRCLLAVIVLAVGLRLALGLAEPMSTESDGGAYLAMAANLVEGNGLLDSLGNRAYYSPGYPMLLAAVFLLTGPKLGAVLAVNLVLAAVSVYMVYRVARCAARAAAARRDVPAVPGAEKEAGVASGSSPSWLAALHTPESAGIAAALAWTLYVPSMAMSNMIHKENLMVPLMLGLAWITLVWPASRRRVAWAALAGCLAGVLAATGATGCAVAGALVVVVVVHGANWRQRAASAAVFLLAALVVMGPWVYRNYRVLGVPVLFTNAGFNMYLGNNPAATGGYMSIGDTPMAAEWNRIKAEGGEAAADREAARRAFQHMREHPGRTLVLFAKKVALFWQPPYLSSAEPESVEKRIARYAWFGEYLVLVGLAVAGLRSIRRTWPLYLAIALFMAIHVPFVFMLRYRLPVIPLLSVCAFLTAVRNAQPERSGMGAGSWELEVGGSELEVGSWKIGEADGKTMDRRETHDDL